MNDKIRGGVLVGIICVITVLLVWGLASPPTTIEFPHFNHA
ncbi:hypothetical protein RCC94_10080 [Exiguobacterium acetylicum]|nr:MULTISPECIES: hypothetical protein [Exiguobacterium]MDQ6467837.1 hypothetical protein [Exiguobacterium acetylicum]